MLHNEIVHKYTPRQEQFVFDSFLTELCLTYELPLCGYITSSTPYDQTINASQQQVVVNNDEELLFLNCSTVKLNFPFFVCNFYTNSLPLMLDDAQNYDDSLINTLMRTINLIAIKRPNYHIGHVEHCILNKYNLVHS